MDEYISKEALLKHLDMAIECKGCPRNADKELHKCVHNPTPQRCTCSEIAQICIRITDFEVSTDVQPVKHGRWIITDDVEHFIAVCSECGRTEDSRAIKDMPYCHCGARMDGEQND